MRNFGVSVMALALASPQLARTCIQIAAVGTIALGSTIASAQDRNDPFGFKKAYAAKKMEPVCQDRKLLTGFMLEIFGHYRANEASVGERQLTEEALAKELTLESQGSAKFLGWQGGGVNGSCHLDLDITLPPDRVAQLGRQPQLRGDMWFNLEVQNGAWALASVTDNSGSGDNSFRRFLAPFTDAMVEARLAQANQARFAAEKQRDDQILAVRKQRTEQALAARREWIRTHPAEYAAQQRAEANRRTAQAADERRRRLACEAHGGTWGQRITELFPACFFRSDR